MRENRLSAEPLEIALPALRFEVTEGARILRMSRAQLYNRIHAGVLTPQKDGARTYIARLELEHYVESCN
jgi:Helix-turn-helix domain